MLSRLGAIATLLTHEMRARMHARFRAQRVRRCIPPELGVAGLAATFRDRNVRYVVLRWFDRLPHVRPGGDIDLLVHDDDVAAAEQLFERSTSGTPVDLYSVTGLDGSDFHGAALLPPDKAAEVLARAVRYKRLYSVPCAEDHFLSLAFECVYHKGVRSGLPTSLPLRAPIQEPKHDYRGTLARLARKLGIKVDLRLESLHDYLVQRGWGPTSRMMPILVQRNVWLAALVQFVGDQPPLF